MTEEKKIKFYSETEEMLNVRSHALGIFLSIVGTVLLVVKSINSGSSVRMISAL